MNHHEVLLTLAEIAVTLAALSAVAGVIESRRAEPSQSRISMRLLRDVAVLGMTAAFFAVLPPIFGGGSGEETQVRRWCSAAALGVWIVDYVTFLREALRAVQTQTFSWTDISVGLAITLLGFGLLTYNVFMPYGAAPERYILAILCLLVLARLDFLAGAFDLRSGPPAA